MAHRSLTKDRVFAAARWRATLLRTGAAGALRRRREAFAALAQLHVVGAVEEFTNRSVRGWVAVPAGDPPVRIALYLDRTEVAATWATDGGEPHEHGEVRPFGFRLADLWAYARTTSEISVRAGGHALPIVGSGTVRRPEVDGRRGPNALRMRLAQGYIFNQYGRLRLSKRVDTAWQSRVMGLYEGVRCAVAQANGYDVFFVYGTLLGAVREGTVIGHDVDVDAAYVSRHRDPKAAARELREIAHVLIGRGFDVTAKRTALHIHHPADRTARLDLFHLYFDDTGTLKFPFGVAGTTQVPEADWQGTTEIDFCGGRGLVPVNAEQLVEHIYGASWRSPKPGFDWTHDRTTRDLAGCLPWAYGREVHWANFYARHPGFDRPSSFCETLLARGDLPTTVVDVGCGDGRDSVAFAGAGCTVLGLDWADAALERGHKRALAAGVEARVRFAACDVTRPAAFTAQLADLPRDGAVLFYLRLFLGTVPAPEQERVLQVIASSARPGDVVAAELRTAADEALPKAFGKHARYFQDSADVRRVLAESGFEPITEDEGTGLAPYDREDPHLYRVIARRG